MADGSGYHSSTAAPDWVSTAAPDWASLEIGILEQISLRLPADADRVRVGHVCRHWRSAVSGDRVVMGRPWILARRGRRFWRSYAFLRLSSSHQDVGTFSAGATIPSAVDVLGASRGWLAVRHGDRVVLTDLISPAKVSLPPSLPGFRIKNVFLSGDPFTAPEWTAFAIAAAANSHSEELASCRRGDTSWTLIDGEDHPVSRYSSVEFHGGRVYAVDDLHKTLICVNGTVATSRTWIPCPPRRDSSNTMTWLVECGGHLLVVQLERSLARRRRRRFCVPLNNRVGYDGYLLGLSFNVSRLRFTKDGFPDSYLTIRDIGDHALFVGESGHAFAVQASGMTGVRSNFLYYVGHMEERMLAFDVDAYQYGATPYSRRGVRRWEPFCWFCPRRPVITT